MAQLFPGVRASIGICGPHRSDTGYSSASGVSSRFSLRCCRFWSRCSPASSVRTYLSDEPTYPDGPEVFGCRGLQRAERTSATVPGGFGGNLWRQPLEKSVAFSHSHSAVGCPTTAHRNRRIAWAPHTVPLFACSAFSEFRRRFIAATCASVVCSRSRQSEHPLHHISLSEPIAPRCRAIKIVPSLPQIEQTPLPSNIGVRSSGVCGYSLLRLFRQDSQNATPLWA